MSSFCSAGCSCRLVVVRYFVLDVYYSNGSVTKTKTDTEHVEQWSFLTKITINGGFHIQSQFRVWFTQKAC